jgi:hypothetical protein
MATKSHLLQEDIAYYNPFLNGSTFTNTTLQATITAIGATRKTVFLPPGTWVISANLTFPTTLDLVIPSGALLDINPGVVVAVNGGLIAPPVRIFAGTGTVTFGTHTDTVYPQWWGATADGVTDDAPAYQAACRTGKEVRVPQGTSMIGTPLVLVSGSSLVGEGRASILKAVANFGDTPVVKNLTDPGSLGTRDTNLRVAHLTIDGNRANNGTGTTAASGIRFVSPLRVSIEHCTILNTKGPGIALFHGVIPAVHPEDVRIEDNVVTGCIFGIACSGGVALLISANTVSVIDTQAITVYKTVAGHITQQVIISHNHIQNTGTDGGHTGILLGGDTGLISYDMHISHNNLTNLTGYGILFANCDGLHIADNILRTVSVIGISNAVPSANLRVMITHNALISCGSIGINYNDSDGAIIECNRLISCGIATASATLQVSSLNGGVIAGNIVTGGVSTGILLTSVTKTVLSGNQVRGNAGSGLVFVTCTDCPVTGGVYDGNVGWGIIESGGLNSSNFNIILGNCCRANSTGGVFLVGAQSLNVNNQT